MTQAIDERTVEAMKEFVASTDKKEEDNLTTLSSGVVVRHKKVPPMILAKIESKFVEPPVPSVYDEQSDRYIPNPDDPNYERELNQFRMDKGNAMLDAMMALGTELVSLPEGLPKPDDEDWIENLAYLGVEVPKLAIGRWLAWVKYVAATDTSDIQELAKHGSQALGITEAEVADSIARFQDTTER